MKAKEAKRFLASIFAAVIALPLLPFIGWCGTTNAAASGRTPGTIVNANLKITKQP
jgi:hypothetical protein